MLIVNLYGAPGAGKSTGAAFIFSRLKMQGVNAELVTEFAKDKVWEESKAVFEDQLYIFAKQHFKISRLRGKVDVVVTDSPMMLSCLYENNDPRYGQEFKSLVKKVADSYDHIDVLVNRIKPYNPKGRFQNESESDNIAHNLLPQVFEEYDINPMTIDGDEQGYLSVVENVLKVLNKMQNPAENPVEGISTIFIAVGHTHLTVRAAVVKNSADDKRVTVKVNYSDITNVLSSPRQLTELKSSGVIYYEGQQYFIEDVNRADSLDFDSSYYLIMAKR